MFFGITQISISRVQYYAPSTVYLAVNVVDRYLSLTKEKVQPVELLLIGVTSLMVSLVYAYHIATLCM